MLACISFRLEPVFHQPVYSKGDLLGSADFDRDTKECSQPGRQSFFRLRSRVGRNFVADYDSESAIIQYGSEEDSPCLPFLFDSLKNTEMSCINL